MSEDTKANNKDEHKKTDPGDVKIEDLEPRTDAKGGGKSADGISVKNGTKIKEVTGASGDSGI